MLLAISRPAWAASASGGGGAGAFGPTINAQKVTNLWSRDIRDGCLDGKDGATPLSYGGVGRLTDEATRLQLAEAIVAYLGDGARNVTAFTTPAEVLPLLDTLAQGGGNAAPGSCTGAVAGHLFDDNGRSFDRDGPLVAFDGGTPPAGAFVRGSIMVDATATDVGMLDPAPTLRIVTPGQPDLLLKDVRDFTREMHARRERLFASTKQSLVAAAAVSQLDNPPKLAELAQTYDVDERSRSPRGSIISASGRKRP